MDIHSHEQEHCVLSIYSYFDTFLKEMLNNVLYYVFPLIDSSHLSTVPILYFSPVKKAKPKQIKQKHIQTPTENQKSE